MKKKIFLMLFVLGYIGIVKAQRQAGGWAVQGRYGIMGGKGEVSSYASSFGVGLNKTIGNKGMLIEGNMIFHDFKIPYEELNRDFTRQFYGLNILTGWSYENFYPLYLNFKVGGFLGYEIVNKGNKFDDVNQVSIPINVNNFNYGIVVSPEIEVILTNFLTLGITFSQYWNVSSKWNKQQYSLEMGIKYYF